MKKEVKIKSKGAAYAPLDEFIWFQGDLKNLPEENYEKLKKQIIELGFSEPVTVWIDGEKLKLLNGHQRVLTLQKMRDDGWRIPHIPYSVVEAKDENEAKRKVLSLTSQFGVLSQEGIADFIHETPITISEINDSFVFPGLVLPDLEPIADKITVDVREHTRELAEDDFQKFEHKCPKCGFEYD